MSFLQKVLHKVLIIILPQSGYNIQIYYSTVASNITSKIPLHQIHRYIYG